MSAPPPAFDQPQGVLFVTTCWWPSLARLIHQCSVAGLRVGIVCPPGHAALAVPGIEAFAYRPFRPLRGLAASIAAFNPSHLVPGDDRAVWHLHRLHRSGTAAQRQLVERSLGDQAGFAATASRAALLHAAQTAGMRVPEGGTITSASDLAAWTTARPAPFVLKIDGAWSGTGVRIAHTEAQARHAFRRLAAGPGLPAAIKQLFINRDPYWLSDWHAGAPPRITAQSYLRGRSGNLAMFCQDGAVLACITAETIACWGDTGPSTIIRLIELASFTEAARALAASLRLNGFVGLDFMIEDTTGEPILIEMNPRVTPLCNIRGSAGHDLIAAACLAWSGRALPAAPALATDLIAHFPLAWHWNAADPRLPQCHQDIPHDAPALVRAMLEPYWPDRHWQARALTWLQRRSGRHDHLTKVRLRGVPILPGAGLHADARKKGVAAAGG
jgi:hypothetical protein